MNYAINIKKLCLRYKVSNHSTFLFSQDKSFIFETLKEYERAKGFIKINDDNVAPTTKGLLRLMLAQHDWD